MVLDHDFTRSFLRSVDRTSVCRVRLLRVHVRERYGATGAADEGVRLNPSVVAAVVAPDEKYRTTWRARSRRPATTEINGHSSKSRRHTQLLSFDGI